MAGAHVLGCAWAGGLRSQARRDAGQCECTRGAGTCGDLEGPCEGGVPWFSADASCEGTVGRGGTATQRALLEFHALFVCIFFFFSLGLIQVP